MTLLIKYLAFALIGVFLYFMGYGIYSRAYKWQGRTTSLKIAFWGFCLIFALPLLVLVLWLVRSDISDYQRAKDDASIRYGYIDLKGNTVIPFLYSYAGPFEHGYALVASEGQSFWIDSAGKKAMNQDMHYRIKYEQRRTSERHGGGAIGYDEHTFGQISAIEPATEGLKVVQFVCSRFITKGHFKYISYHYGYQDSTGKTVIPCSFYDAYPFSEGLASVTDTLLTDMRYKWGYIDHSGKYAINPVYLDADDFHEGKAAVSKITR
ncbi:MAG: WG repeat-containing protein [Bacteroidia bacterium]